MQHTNGFEKIQSISEQVATIINRECHCQITAAYITSAKLSCDPQETTDVIFRARLSSTPKVSDTNMINFLHNWIMSGIASLTIQHVDLDVDSACDILIDSFSDPVCSKAPPITFTTSGPVVSIASASGESNIIGALVGTILVAIVIIVVVILALHIFKHRKQLKQYIPRLVFSLFYFGLCVPVQLIENYP